MSRLFQAGVLVVAMVAACAPEAEACRGRRTAKCCCSQVRTWRPPSAAAQQPTPHACPAFDRKSRSALDCLDEQGDKLPAGWYWQAYIFATGKIVKKGPFADQRSAERNMNDACPSSDCCPAKDPYQCE
jgi:hypothetical protein